MYRRNVKLSYLPFGREQGDLGVNKRRPGRSGLNPGASGLGVDEDAGSTKHEVGGPLAARGRWIAATAVGLIGALAWSSWPALSSMAARWSSDPRYTHGYLVPLFAAWLLWSRRGRLELATMRSSWWGLVWVLAGGALKVLGAHYFLGWFDMISLLPSLVGVVMLIGGGPALRWAWPSIAFLAFMVPLPYRAEMVMGAPLQGLASSVSTYILQTCGVSATAEGNVIVLDSGKINVVESCNGMGMMFMFLAFATGVALVSARPIIDTALIVASGIPVALFANILRITVTGLLQVTLGDKVAGAVYHDLAGWLMMPIALLMLGLIIRFISLILVEEDPRATPRFQMADGTIIVSTR